MLRPRCIRVFFSLEKAEHAKKVLAKGGIQSYITEDRFYKLRLPDLGMLPRYQLYIDQYDIPRAAVYLAKKLRKNRTKKNDH